MSDSVKLSEAAKRLGVNVRTLQRCVSGGLGPGLPVRRRGRKRFVSLAAAAEYLRAHSRVAVAATPAPPSPAKPGPVPAAPASVADELAARIPNDPEAVLRKLSTDLGLLNDLGPALARVMVAACEGHRRAAAAETKAADMLTSDQYVKDHRAALRCFVEHVEQHGAKRLAARIVAVLREQLSVDISSHAGAQSVIAFAVLEDLQVSISEFRQALEDRCNSAKGDG